MRSHPEHSRFRTFTLQSAYLHLDNTLTCGQIFCWQKIAPHLWSGWIDNAPVTVHTADETTTKLIITYSPDQLTERRIAEFFCLDEDPADALRTLPSGDPYLAQALCAAGGITILRQPHWECLASFICSSQKQIAHIKQINSRLRTLFGDCGRFPSPSALAVLSPDQLRRAGLGFRAPYLHATACLLTSRPHWLQNLSTLPTAALIEKLTNLPGVGHKIAHCVALFAYHRLEAFPLDVWVHRIVTGLYFPRLRKKPTLQQIYAFGPAYFGPHCGLAQQILFHWLRKMPPARRAEMFSRARKIKIPLAIETIYALRLQNHKLLI